MDYAGTDSSREAPCVFLKLNQIPKATRHNWNKPIMGAADNKIKLITPQKLQASKLSI